MRLPLVYLLAACGSAPPAPVTPKPTAPVTVSFWSTKPAEPEEGPLVALATQRTYHLLVVEEFGPECRAFRVEQSKERASDLAFLVDDSYGVTERIGFVSHGARLELQSRTRTEKKHTQTTACSGIFSAREVDGGLDVSGARWFDRAEDCAAALAAKEHVATDLTACAWKPIANLQEQAASQRRLEAVLRFGGSLFSGDACEVVHATPKRTNTAKSFEGELWTELRDGARRGKSGFGYRAEANGTSIVLLGPTSTWSDGTGFGMLCGYEQELAFGKESVEFAETMYFSHASCRAARADRAARRALLPGDEDARELASRQRPLAGC